MLIYQASLFRKILLQHHCLFPSQKINVLRSFGIANKEEIEFMITHRDKVGSLILDSGVWTLNNRKTDAGIKISVNTLKSYLHQNANYFDFYFNFDSDFTNKGFGTNLHNQRVLENAGLHPVPVIHNIYGDEIEYFLKKNYPMLALGSNILLDLDEMYDVVMTLYKEGVKVHLFGCTDYDFLSSVPCYSSDSSTWALAGAYGNIMYWNSNIIGNNKGEKINLGEFERSSNPKSQSLLHHKDSAEIIAHLQDTFDINYSDLLLDNGYYRRMLINSHFFVELEERVNQEHKKRGFMFEE